jgi:hypothetical protein
VKGLATGLLNGALNNKSNTTNTINGLTGLFNKKKPQ